jgi:signal transduction histidine kinase
VGGILAAAGISLVFTLGSEVVLDSLMTYVPLVVFVALMATVIGMLVYKLEEETRIARKRIAKTAEEQTEQLGEMRARADAVSEMATTLSATRNFEKILDETLNIGNLGWRKTSRERGVSMVLLVRSHDEKLYVATSRGLRHQDQHRVISGRTGIVAEAFDEGLPVIGGDLDDDPDLSQFIGMSGMRSTLCIPLRAGYDTFGALLYASDAEDAFSEDQIVTLHAIATQATVAMQNAVLYNSLLQEKERLIQIEEDARKALVRDLHDVPAQSIMTVVMKIRIIQRYLEGTVEQQREVPNELKSVEELALRANEEIRHVLFKLRPLALESQGLTVALNQLADKMQETYDQTVKIRVGKGLERLLDTSQQGALFYLVEEAVNNARKYAEASQISVAVGRQGQLLVIRIQDNGKGFDAQAVNANYNERGSFGMVNMRERAELLDGTLSLESALGKGTTITVSIPIASLERERQMAEPRQIAAPTTKLAATAMRQFERSRPRVTP